MKTFISRSIPFKDIMKDLSEEMKTVIISFVKNIVWRFLKNMVRER